MRRLVGAVAIAAILGGCRGQMAGHHEHEFKCPDGGEKIEARDGRVTCRFVQPIPQSDTEHEQEAHSH